MKRIISVMIAVLLAALCLMPLSVSAAEMTEPGYLYFQTPTGGVSWSNFKAVYCHIWGKDSGEIYAWQSKNEQCENLGNGYWRYDVSGLDFDPDGEYSLIFSNETGQQTYNLNVTSSCLGDIAYCSGDTCQNPVDGVKTCAVARWINNGDRVHPAIEMDSNGLLLNVDEIDAEDAEMVWGSAEGTSYALPEVAAEAVEIESRTDSVTDLMTDNADGINLNTATTWIIIVCALCMAAILAVVVILAKKNRGN